MFLSSKTFFSNDLLFVLSLVFDTSIFLFSSDKGQLGLLPIRTLPASHLIKWERSQSLNLKVNGTGDLIGDRFMEHLWFCFKLLNKWRPLHHGVTSFISRG